MRTVNQLNIRIEWSILRSSSAFSNICVKLLSYINFTLYFLFSISLTSQLMGMIDGIFIFRYAVSIISRQKMSSSFSQHFRWKCCLNFFLQFGRTLSKLKRVRFLFPFLHCRRQIKKEWRPNFFCQLTLICKPKTA